MVFERWWEVVVMVNNNHPRKRAHTLVFEVGERCWSWQTTTTLENEHTRSCSRVVGAGAHKQSPPSKTSIRARVQGWWEVVVMVNNLPRNEHTRSCSRLVRALTEKETKKQRGGTYPPRHIEKRTRTQRGGRNPPRHVQREQGRDEGQWL